MRRAAILLFLSLGATVHALDENRVKYTGGTATTIRDNPEGMLAMNSDTEALFDAGNKGTLTIPYAAIQSLEYGRKELFRLPFPAIRFVSRERHLTVRFRDATGMPQMARFELGQNVLHLAFKTFETRTGKAIAFLVADDCEAYRTSGECPD